MKDSSLLETRSRGVQLTDGLSGGVRGAALSPGTELGPGRKATLSPPPLPPPPPHHAPVAPGNRRRCRESLPPLIPQAVWNNGTQGLADPPAKPDHRPRVFLPSGAAAGLHFGEQPRPGDGLRPEFLRPESGACGFGAAAGALGSGSRPPSRAVRQTLALGPQSQGAGSHLYTYFKCV